MLIERHRPRDSQRKRLYEAQSVITAFARDPLPTVPDMQDYVDELLRSPWLQMRFTATVLDPVGVRGGRQRNAYAQTHLSAISIPATLRSKFVVIHELCHVLCDRHYGPKQIAAHGREFASLLVACVGQFLGENDAEELLLAFSLWGVEFDRP